MSSQLVHRLYSIPLFHKIIQVNASIGSLRHKRREPKRKPIWLPQAPSKWFKIPEPVVYPKDEEEQLEHLHWQYQSELLSIRDYCRDNFYLPAKTSGGLSAEQVQEEETEQARLLKENEEENRRVSQIRAERRSRDHKMFESDVLQAEEERQQFLDSLQTESKGLFEAELKRSVTYITKETLDARIEEALANPVHYDYAITRDGKVVTEGTVHINALVPSAIPSSSSNIEHGMIETGEVKLRPKKLFFDPLELEKDFV